MIRFHINMELEQSNMVDVVAPFYLFPINTLLLLYYLDQLLTAPLIHWFQVRFSLLSIYLKNQDLSYNHECLSLNGSSFFLVSGI